MPRKNKEVSEHEFYKKLNSYKIINYASCV